VGDVYQAGTLSGNPLAMAAGSKTLEILSRPGIYQRLEELGAKAEASIREIFASQRVNAQLNRVGSVSCLFFTDLPVESYQDALTSNTQAYAAYFWKMLENGVYLAPSQFEAAFISCVHGEEELKDTALAIERSLAALKKDNLL
jgi:glutamate-1-semialdehyde 2,1-aminomutase